MQIEGLDHLVLTVADLGRTRDFYERVLGMEPVVFGEGRHALSSVALVFENLCSKHRASTVTTERRSSRSYPAPCHPGRPRTRPHRGRSRGSRDRRGPAR